MKSVAEITKEIEEGIKKFDGSDFKPKCVLLGSLSYFTLNNVKFSDKDAEYVNLENSSMPYIKKFLGLEIITDSYEDTGGQKSDSDERVEVFGN